MDPDDPADGLLGLDPADLERICVHNLLEQVPEQIYFKDLHSRFVRVSRGQAGLFDVASPTELIGKSDFDFFAAEHAQRAYDDEQEIIRTGVAKTHMDEKHTWPDRQDSWNTASKYPLRDFDGRIVGTFGISRDITRRVLAEEALRRQSDELAAANLELSRVEAELRRMLDESPDAVVKLDRDLRHVYVNPMAQQVIGRSAEEILGRTNAELGQPVDFVRSWEAAVRDVLTTGTAAELEYELPTAAGRRWFHARLAPTFDPQHRVSGVVAASRDMTDRRGAEEALAHQAVHDPLTGLANRVLVVDRVQRALVRLERAPSIVALLFLDIDRFKVVNDSLGHAAGDALLREVAARLVACARRGDTVARFGGDEFVVVCENLTTDEHVRVLADRIGAALAQPVVYDGHVLHVSASIGIATTGDWQRPAEDLLRDADAAMYQAKEHGRGRFEFFDASVRDRANARLAIETGLRRALDKGEFHLVYQPLICLETREITGVEALVRWRHPERGPMSPADFIPIAEETRLIVPIDRWVLDEACRQLVEWNAQRGSAPPLTMAVNISGRQLSEPDVVETVAGVLSKYGIEPRLLCLEVTETAMLQEGDRTGDVFRELSALGVQIALDDFGTGYSSLGHLQRFPVNILKIDRSFVERMCTGADGAAIVSAVTAMAHALGMKTVGEGIETEAQLDGLTGLGCDDGQGYLLARPVAPGELTAELGLRPVAAREAG